MNGYVVPVTQKGQVTIPLLLRKRYGIKPYGKVRMESGGGYIRVKLAEDVVDIAGFLKHKGKGKSVLKAREELERNYTRA